MGLASFQPKGTYVTLTYLYIYTYLSYGVTLYVQISPMFTYSLFNQFSVECLDDSDSDV